MAARSTGARARAHVRTKMHLPRSWTLYILCRRDQCYDKAFVPVLTIRTATQLWEAWDSGLRALTELLLSERSTVIAAGAPVHGIALFAGDAVPEWSAYPDGGAARAPFSTADEALEHVMIALGDAGAVAPVGLRLLRGRKDAGCRAEHWLTNKTQVEAMRTVVGEHMQCIAERTNE